MIILAGFSLLLLFFLLVIWGLDNAAISRRYKQLLDDSEASWREAVEERDRMCKEIWEASETWRQRCYSASKSNKLARQKVRALKRANVELQAAMADERRLSQGQVAPLKAQIADLTERLSKWDIVMSYLNKIQEDAAFAANRSWGHLGGVVDLQEEIRQLRADIGRLSVPKAEKKPRKTKKAA